MTRRRWAEKEGTRDLLIVGTLVTMGLLEAFLAPPAFSTRWLQAILSVAYTGVLLWRRRWPVPVLAVVMVMGPLVVQVNTQGGLISYVFSALLASYAVGRLLDRPATWWGPALTVAFPWAALVVIGGKPSDFLFIAGMYGGAWAVGYALRQRDTRINDLSGEAEELRRDVAEEAARAVAEERTRIARELHDIVSHSISVITIQAQAVRRRLGPANQREIDDLRDMEITARQAMAEMRRLLGVLRASSSSEIDRAPQPGLAQLDRLAHDTSAAGVRVSIQVRGEPVPLSPGLDLTAYRVVQEALTNVRRHAGAGCAEVFVSYTGDTVQIRVDDDGPASSAGAPPPGHGLAGMTERVNLYGGKLTVGPRPDTGYRVSATLPIREATVG